MLMNTETRIVQFKSAQADELAAVTALDMIESDIYSSFH
jgi:hypothetical protein